MKEQLESLPDARRPSAFTGQVVHINRAVSLTLGETGRVRRLYISDWGDEARYEPKVTTT